VTTLTIQAGADPNNTSKTITVGNGAGVITAASPSYADVSAAIALANSGDTVIVPAGSATWSQQLVITKAVRIIGAGIGNTIITRGYPGGRYDYMIHYIPDAASIAADALFRFSGFTIDCALQGSLFLLTNAAHTAMSKNRIDHNNIQGCSENRIIEIDGAFWGVMDNNILYGGTLLNYGQNEISWTYFTAQYGRFDNFFYEDNVYTIIGNNDAFGSGVGGRYCARHNTIYYRPASPHTGQIFDIHGNGPAGGNLGTMICEIYDNTIDLGPNAAQIGDHRGGYGLIYNNYIYTTSGSDSFGPSVREEYLDSDNPPVNNVISGQPQHVSDSYYWNNRQNRNGVITPIEYYFNGQVDYGGSIGLVPQADRDFHAEAIPFNGTTGCGFGLLANRPTTCTQDGVAYWATDTKTLYRWTATKGWEEYYKPYPYPHPLRDIQ
jgi:hypothetical protein